MLKALEHFSKVTTYEEFEQLRIENTDFTPAILEILERHNIPNAELTLFSDGCNLVYAVGNERVIKVFPPCHQDQYTNDLVVMRHLDAKLSVPTPRIEFTGEFLGWPYIVMDFLDGTLLEGLWETLPQSNKKILISELGALIKEVHSLDTDGLIGLQNDWDHFIKQQMEGCVEQHRKNELPPALIEELPSYIKAIELPRLKKPVLLTGEYTPMNCLVKQTDGVWHLAGLIDFGDAKIGLPQYDLLGPGAFLIQGDKDLLRAFLIGYGYNDQSLNKELSQQMTSLMLLHQYSNLKIQIRINGWESKVKSLTDLQDLVWGL